MMGGIGSGNWYRWDRKTTTGETKSLDVRQLARKGLLEPGNIFSWAWYVDGEKIGYIKVSSGQERITLSYRVCEYGDEWESVDETVKLTRTDCNYGGSRSWFICPATGCGRRVALLYGAGKYFACRHCYDLAYASQHENRVDRLSRKARNIMTRLGADPYGDEIPERPKGMHHRTYQHFMRQYHYFNDRVWDAYEFAVNRF